ncbi:Protein CBG12467 [Caenorhabditis briggsae]|uniref:Protein CBG12467 n=1 Tax=Caenorhabditis briggsae TaxID=6238 RepID=A8XFI2_CAEBR|nr:Protein CBG12467 [Caenorhabditis briggsae]CAP31443.3 Protein CBG12467 [Caenorhabditis briggsae]
MTENFDFFIETCILYDTFHWKSPENSYQTICRKYGPDLISYTDFKALFNRISIENCNESTCKKNLAEILKSSYTALKSCILNDVSCGKSIDIAHDKILEVIGKVPWTHFQYWFQRFSDGNWDFGESPAPMAPEFMDLPIGIVKTIIENCDYSNQWTLRTVSRHLKIHVDLLKSPIGELKFRCNFDHFSLKIDKKYRIFGRENFKIQKYLYFYKNLDNLEISKNPNFEELAFLELAERLSNPKLKLEVLEFKAEQCQDFEKIEKILEQIGRKIWVKRVKIR